MAVMIPRLDQGRPVEDTYLAFLDALRGGGFRGDVGLDQGSRLVHATDNSVYQVLPQAVVFPRDAEDVQLFAALAGDARFAEIHYCVRGGGTGTNGQSLTDGVVLDVSRHMDGILELNLKEGWVRVQPGVVLDQLNDAMRTHGVFFAPSLSPSNRATLGGMIGTDACGKGSRVYGRTSEHVLALTTVLADGTTWTSEPLDGAALEAVMERTDLVGHVHREVHRVITTQAALIEARFPRIKRFMTGYNLARITDPADGRFNLNALLTGAEGTLGVVVEARLKLTPIPTTSRVVLLRYGSFEDALGSAEAIAIAGPHAIETIDDVVLGLARRDVIWHEVGAMVDGEGAPDLVRAVNLVEFASSDPQEVEDRVRGLLADVDAGRGGPGQPIGAWLAADAAQADALWRLRKKGVGLLGAREGRRKPVAFVEDTVVPPEHLRDYVRDFRKILDDAGLVYGMFGHVDVGCLHVRPALDLRRPEDEALLRRISDEVCALVQSYGGVIWGEHGKGFRSEYNPRFFGEALFAEICRIKAAFDPRNQLNRGKLAVAPGGDVTLVSLDGPKRGRFDREIAPADQERFAAALACNGNGLCHDWHPDHVMCPSSRVTRDRIHSPRGRAGVLREWLRQLHLAGHVAEPPAPAARWRAPLRWLRRLGHSLGRRLGRADYSHDVYDAMAGCLSCKACATQCPIRVDVPAFKADFLALYHTRYLRPLTDLLVAGLERTLAVLSRAPRLGNLLMDNPLSRLLLHRLGGIVDSPRLATSGVRAGLAARGERLCTDEDLAGLSVEARAGSVLLLQDAFTSFYEPRVLLAARDLLTGLGLKVYIPAFFPNGKGLQVKGFMGRFRRVAARNAARLQALSRFGLPILGVDPAVVLTYRDEIPLALGAAPDGLGFRVQLLQEWLATQPDRLRRRRVTEAGVYRLAAHCTERTAVPEATRWWDEVFGHMGLQLEPLQVGCCGMCGAYGHEARHRAESRGIYDMSWGPKMPPEARGQARVLATGHSCRSQVKRFGGFVPRHPVEVLAELIVD